MLYVSIIRLIARASVTGSKNYNLGGLEMMTMMCMDVDELCDKICVRLDFFILFLHVESFFFVFFIRLPYLEPNDLYLKVLGCDDGDGDDEKMLHDVKFDFFV